MVRPPADETAKATWASVETSSITFCSGRDVEARQSVNKGVKQKRREQSRWQYERNSHERERTRHVKSICWMLITVGSWDHGIGMESTDPNLPHTPGVSPIARPSLPLPAPLAGVPPVLRLHVLRHPQPSCKVQANEPNKARGAGLRGTACDQTQKHHGDKLSSPTQESPCDMAASRAFWISREVSSSSEPDGTERGTRPSNSVRRAAGGGHRFRVFLAPR